MVGSAVSSPSCREQSADVRGFAVIGSWPRPETGITNPSSATGASNAESGFISTERQAAVSHPGSEANHGVCTDTC